MDAISRKNVIVAAPSLREIEHVTSVHHPLLITSQRASAARIHPCNIWREGKEGQDAARFAGAKICLFCITCPRAQPGMPVCLSATYSTAAKSCESCQQRAPRSQKLQPFLHVKFPRTRKNWQTTRRIRWFPRECKTPCKIVSLPISVG